jgi:hypothetical protein
MGSTKRGSQGSPKKRVLGIPHKSGCATNVGHTGPGGHMFTIGSGNKEDGDMLHTSIKKMAIMAPNMAMKLPRNGPAVNRLF